MSVPSTIRRCPSRHQLTTLMLRAFGTLKQIDGCTPSRKPVVFDYIVHERDNRVEFRPWITIVSFMSGMVSDLDFLNSVLLLSWTGLKLSPWLSTTSNMRTRRSKAHARLTEDMLLSPYDKSLCQNQKTGNVLVRWIKYGGRIAFETSGEVAYHSSRIICSSHSYSTILLDLLLTHILRPRQNLRWKKHHEQRHSSLC